MRVQKAKSNASHSTGTFFSIFYPLAAICFMITLHVQSKAFILYYHLNMNFWFKYVTTFFPTYLSEWFFLLKRIFIILRTASRETNQVRWCLWKWKKTNISVDVVLLSLFYENSTLWYCNTHCIFKIQGQKELSIKPFTFKKSLFSVLVVNSVKDCVKHQS